MTYCAINAYYILISLIENRIYCDRGFSGLTVAYYKLTLTSAYRNHTVYRQNSGFKRSIDRTALHNTRCGAFNRKKILCFKRQTIYRATD